MRTGNASGICCAMILAIAGCTSQDHPIDDPDVKERLEARSSVAEKQLSDAQKRHSKSFKQALIPFKGIINGHIKKTAQFTPVTELPEESTTQDASSCPDDSSTIVQGNDDAEKLTVKSARTCVVAAGGEDVVFILPKADQSLILGGNDSDAVFVAPLVDFTVVAAGDEADLIIGTHGTVTAYGQAGDDNLYGGPAPNYYFGGPGNDYIAVKAGDDIAEGGDGDDYILGGAGDDLLGGGNGLDFVESGSGNDSIDGGNGSDHLFGKSGNDLIEGGNGDDHIVGGKGNDRLLGQHGDDILIGGSHNDAIVPGAGRDRVDAGPGDDLVTILASCQAVDGEILEGGTGQDTLLSPLSEEELTARGVTVTGFETIRVFPADGFQCDSVSCNCGALETVPKLPGDPCDFSNAATGVTPPEAAAAGRACNQILAAIPDLTRNLSDEASDAEVQALFESDPDWMAALAPLQLGEDHHEPGFDPTNPIPFVDTTSEPCDFPNLDSHVGVARGGIQNCSAGREDQVQEALAMAEFLQWRMQQQIDAIVDAEDNPAEAEALWNQSADDDPSWGRFALSYWFGQYSANQARGVQSTVERWGESLIGDDDGIFGFDENVQCFNPLKWWQYIAFGATSPATVAYKTILNPCFLRTANAHAFFALPVVGRVGAAAVLYPFASIELCREAFDEERFEPVERKAGLILHELLHWKSNQEGDLRDRNHEACGGEPCYGDENARSLAEQAQDIAVVNIDNYEEWSNVVATQYLGGYCDDTDAPLCFTSDCCGDGILQESFNESCDGNDFGTSNCLTEAGFTEGNLQCSGDCQTISSEMCTGSCGNAAIDPALNEECDQADFGGASCGSLFGSDMGSLACTDLCTVDGSGCSGLAPASYAECGVEADSLCLTAPELCHLEADAGQCTGGPCVRTDPSDRLAGQLDPDAIFHPKGNFRDDDGNLYRCEAGPDGPRSCVDDEGFGVCLECGLGEGQTMLGCPCAESNQCGTDLQCFGGNFPSGGYCWTDQGPPDFQCEQGRCGQSFPGPDGGAYCEHYALSGNARCMPQRCDNITAQQCAETNLICNIAGDACAVECEVDSDCSEGWPAGFSCTPALECAQ